MSEKLAKDKLLEFQRDSQLYPVSMYIRKYVKEKYSNLFRLNAVIFLLT